MSYCRVDYWDGSTEYYENDTITAKGEERCSYLMEHHLYYRRIKYLPTLPPGKRVTVMVKHNKGWFGVSHN